MQKIMNRLPKLEERSYFMAALIGSFLFTSMLRGIGFVLFTFFILPWSIGVFHSSIKQRRLCFTGYNVSLMLSMLFLGLATILNRDLSASTLYGLALTGVFTLTAGIIPRGTKREDIKIEMYAVFMIAVCLMVPFMLLGVISVFSGRPIYFLWEKSPIGIGTVGAIQDRIRVFCHPNITSRGALIGFICAAYCMLNTQKKAIRVFLAASMVVFVLTMVHTQSRTINIVFGIVAGLFLFRNIYIKAKNKTLGFVIGSIAVVAVFALVLKMMSLLFSVDIGIAKAIMSTDELAADAVSRAVSDGTFDVLGNGRGFIWENALKYLMDHPSFLVFGMGSGDVMSRIAIEIPDMGNYAHLHNGLLDALARGGVPMLVCCLASLLLLIKPCVSLLLAPEAEGNKGAFILPIFVGAMLIASLTEAILFSTPSLATFFFYLVAGYIMYGYRENKEAKLPQK